jgi:hypothetical protein
VPGFLQIWRLEFRPKSSILVSSDHKILFLMVWESLGAFWQTPSGLSRAFYWGVASIWPLYHKGLIGGVLQMVVLLKASPISTEEHWSSVRVTIGFLFTSLSKALLYRLLSLDGRPALERVLVVPNFFHLRMMEGHCVLGDLQCCRHFLVPFPRSVPTDNSFDLFGLILRWHALSTMGSHTYRCVPFQIMSNQLNLPQVDSNQVVETSKGWSMEGSEYLYK